MGGWGQTLTKKSTKLQRRYFLTLPLLRLTLQVSLPAATAQIIPSVILSSPIKYLHLSQVTGTSWTFLRTVEMALEAGFVLPQPAAQVSCQ